MLGKIKVLLSDQDPLLEQMLVDHFAVLLGDEHLVEREQGLITIRSSSLHYTYLSLFHRPEEVTRGTGFTEHAQNSGHALILLTINL